MLEFDINKALYRRNNFGQPTVWTAEYFDYGSLVVYHGIVGKSITKEFIRTNRDVNAEIKTRFLAKRKTGYKLLSELKDNVNLPVERELLSYLSAYLPEYRTTADGSLLPMLAKVYEPKVFNRCSAFIGQWKINGLRCFVSAERVENDIFRTYRLRFQSREGTYWNSLDNLEEYLIFALGEKMINKMLDEHYILDGELYLPGLSVNEVNHAVKDPKCAENKLIQYWCYDLAIDNESQSKRQEFLNSHFTWFVRSFPTVSEHWNNKERFIVLPTFDVYTHQEATEARNKCIDLGFEGLILRNPTAEYQYGKRNSSMIKYKRSTDGKFTIIDIYPEGIKRPDIPLFLCKNDINDSTFEVHLSMSLDVQRSILKNKEKYIGKQMLITYGERSGIKQVPFHVKDVMIIV